MRCDSNAAAKGFQPVGKVVDLLEYRRWLALDQAGVWEEPKEECDPEEPEYDFTPRPAPPLRRRSRHRREALRMELWAGAAVLVMALIFTVWVLFF